MANTVVHIVAVSVFVILLGGSLYGAVYGVTRSMHERNKFKRVECGVANCTARNHTCERTDTSYCGDYCYSQHIVYFACMDVTYTLTYGMLSLRQQKYVDGGKYDCALAAKCYVSRDRIRTDVRIVGERWRTLAGGFIAVALVSVIVLIIYGMWFARRMRGEPHPA